MARIFCAPVDDPELVYPAAKFAIAAYLIVHGPPERCREHIQRYIDAGATTPALTGAGAPAPGAAPSARHTRRRTIGGAPPARHPALLSGPGQELVVGSETRVFAE